MKVADDLVKSEVAGLGIAVGVLLGLRLGGIQGLDMGRDGGEGRARVGEVRVARHGLHDVVRADNEVSVSARDVKGHEGMSGPHRHERLPCEAVSWGVNA